MKNKTLIVNRNIRIRMRQMYQTLRRAKQKQHLQQIALYESFRKVDRLHESFRKMWEIPKPKITFPAEAP